MARILFKGSPVQTAGDLPPVGKRAPGFELVKNDLSKASMIDFKGKKIVFNIFPSIDTGVCASSVRKFNVEAAKLENTVILNVSLDLPFAQKRFCGAEGIDKAVTLSAFRSSSFGNRWGLTMTNGPLAGLFSRAVVVVDEKGVVRYAEQVPEITQEPDYAKALAALA